jgi:DNA polymerase-3 subunit alpha
MVGPGRGSAAGSLVAFLLKITQVDPLKYNLLFERFLNPERKTMPDIDLDFQDDRREEILEYLHQKYGTYHVATIVTYQTIGAKYALRDVFRVFGKSIETVNKISKLISFEYQADLQGAIDNSQALQAYFEHNQQEFLIAMKLIGLPRQTGTHAAGVILSDIDLREVLPIRLSYNKMMQTQFDMNYLEQLGLIKMDLLGLRNLSTLQEIKHAVFQANQTKIDFTKIPLNEAKVFQQLNEGKTTGIFQLESPGMTDLVVKMQVKSIEDISAASALFRPGPKEMIPEYLTRRRSQKKVSQYIIDPSLTEILGQSYGIILYQEQVIEVLKKVAGFSLSKADIVRRAMSKKNYQQMQLVKEEFLQAALKNGYELTKAQAI